MRQPSCLLIIVHSVLIAGVPTSTRAAGVSESPIEVIEDASGFSLTCRGITVQTTGRAIEDPRLIRIPGSPGVAVLWDERRSGGPALSFYSLSLDGRRFARVRQASFQIRLRYAEFDPLIAPPEVAPRLAAAPEAELCIVQFLTRPIEAYSEAIREHGGVVHTFLADQARIARMSTEARAAVQELPFVRWVGPMHAAYKIEEGILDEIAGGFAVGPRRYSIMVYERGPAAQERVAARIRADGGEVHGTTPLGFRLEATLDLDQVLAVARLDEVMFIDRKGEVETDMDLVRAIGGGNFVHSTLGYLGTGVRGEMVDTELELDHPEWAHSPMVHLEGGDVPHGTRVFGIMFAQGLNPRARGLLPDGQGIYAYRTPLLGGGPTRYQHTAELVDPAGPYRAVFQTASTGDPVTTEYTTISAEMDDILFLYDLLATQSQSNTGDQRSRPQAWAKNIVSCGGIRHRDTLDRSDDAWDNYASIGPAADGRVKPTLAHFCDYVYTTDVGGGYTASGSGTSVATPITAGHFGLLFQMWHEGVFPGFGGGPSVFDDRPHMTTAKALLVNTAHRYDWHVAGPNSDLDRFKQGWGMADLARLYEARDRLLVIDESDVLEPFESRRYVFDVSPEDTEFRATLVYADPRGNVGAAHHRINDLSLRATDPLGRAYWGNNGLAAGNWSVAGGESNTIDTVENVFIEDPEPGQWTVEVIADEIHEDSHVETPELDADFALVVAVETPMVIPEIPILYDNGPLASYPGQGFGGADASVRESVSLGELYMGYSHHVAASARVADDFTVEEGATWTIQAVDFWAYQTGAGAHNPTITEVNLRIWDGSPMVAASAVIHGDTLTNLLTSTVWDSLYRTDETNIPTATNRAVYRNRCTVPEWTLPSGTYWIDWQSDGILAEGPFVPPISIAGQTHPPGANAVQYSDGTWHPVQDGGSLTPDDFKFVIRGTTGGTARIAALSPIGAGARVRIWPNPVGTQATIDLTITRRGTLSLRIYDLSGRLLRTLVDEPVPAGARTLSWDGRDQAGLQLPSGTYFYRLHVDGRLEDTGKTVILR